MARLDEFLPVYDAREYHDRAVPGGPEDAVAAALGAVFVVGPFSALIRRRWLAAAERAPR